MSPPDFDNVFKSLGLFLEGIAKLSKCWDQGIAYLSHSCYVHCRRESAIVLLPLIKHHTRSDIRIVAALAHVDMVIGMNGLLGALLAPKNLNCSIGDNLRPTFELKDNKTVSGKHLLHYNSCYSASHFLFGIRPKENGR